MTPRGDGGRSAGDRQAESADEAELLLDLGRVDAARDGAGDTQEWFALLDAWGATGHSHTEIARWLHETHGVPGWWSQNITVELRAGARHAEPGTR